METHREVPVTSVEEIQRRSRYQAYQTSTRPPYWGVDLDPARRPGVPMMRRDPRPLPNARLPIEPQQGPSAVPRHGRPNKQMTPVFGTATPLKGLSGRVRLSAYRRPDHYPSHWLLMILGDRVDAWELRTRRALTLAVPLAAAAWLVRRGLRAR